MAKTIEGVYEGGVLRPLSPLRLEEHEKLRITLEEKESVVRTTSGMFSGLDNRTIEEIALSPGFLTEET